MEIQMPGQDVGMNEDSVSMLMRKHFEYGLTYCVKSVQCWFAKIWRF